MHMVSILLGQREDASRRHPYRASSPSRAGHVTVARSMTNPTDGTWYGWVHDRRTYSSSSRPGTNHYF